MLNDLKRKNPRLPVFDVREEAFRPYGRVLTGLSLDGIIAAGNQIPMPQSGSAYEASTAAFEALPIAREITDACYGQLDAQIGFCWGYNSTLNALEWHTSSEVNIALTDMVLILAKREDIDSDGVLDSAKCRAFFVPQGTAVEVYATSLHYCPCQVSDSGFRSVVALPRDTNTDLAAGEHEPLLWAKNKWLIAHPDCRELCDDGAVVGIRGENFTLAY